MNHLQSGATQDQIDAYLNEGPEIEESEYWENYEEQEATPVLWEKGLRTRERCLCSFGECRNHKSQCSKMADVLLHRWPWTGEFGKQVHAVTPMCNACAEENGIYGDVLAMIEPLDEDGVTAISAVRTVRGPF